jgi:hypothetical protein
MARGPAKAARKARALSIETERSAASRPKADVIITTPTYNGMVPTRYVMALTATQALLARNGITSAWLTKPGDSLVCRARNILAETFLESTGTHCLWIDSDILWQADDVLRMLEHGHDFVAGAYRLKDDSGLFAFGPQLDDSHAPTIDQRTGCMEIEWAGTGFALVARTVFERIAEAYPEGRIRQRGRVLANGQIERGREGSFDYFPVGLDDGFYFSEDMGFSYLWRAAGGRVWLDPTVSLTHMGACDYAGGDPTVQFDRFRQLLGYEPRPAVEEAA